jgi:hypothetical protein
MIKGWWRHYRVFVIAWDYGCKFIILLTKMEQIMVKEKITSDKQANKITR